MAGLPELYKREKEYSEVYSIMASKLGSVKAGEAKTLPRVGEGKSVAREEVERKYEIDLNRALKIARMGWEDIKRELREHLKSEWRSPEAIEAVAQALVEEARARARDIAKRHFGSESEDLVDLIARYILAITLAEEHIGEEVEIRIEESPREKLKDLIGVLGKSSEEELEMYLEEAWQR